MRVEFQRKLLLEHRCCSLLGFVLYFADSVPFLTGFFGFLGSLSSFRSKLCFLSLLHYNICVVDSSYRWSSDSSADSVDSVADNASADDLLDFFLLFLIISSNFLLFFFFLNFAFFKLLAGMPV